MASPKVAVILGNIFFLTRGFRAPFFIHVSVIRDSALGSHPLPQ